MSSTTNFNIVLLFSVALMVYYYGFIDMSTIFFGFQKYMETRSFMYEKFKKLCENKGVSSYRISQETGITQSTFSDWKNGRSVPKQDKLKKIADYFGVDVAYFYDDDDSNKGYYVDDGTKEIAQEIFDNKDLRLLFDAAKDASPEDLQTVHTMLLALKSKER